MFSDVLEEQEFETGSQSEALVTSTNDFMHKLIAGISVLGGGIMITWAGFDNNLTPIESELAAFKLGLISVVSKTCGVLLSILALYFYDIDKNSHEKYVNNLGYKGPEEFSQDNPSSVDGY